MSPVPYKLRGYETVEYFPDLVARPVKCGFKYKIHTEYPIREYVSKTLPVYIFGAALPKPIIEPYGVEYSLKKRIGNVPPGKPTHAMYKRLRKFVYKFCHDNLTPLNRLMTFEEWLDESTYPRDKKEKFIELHEQHGSEEVFKAKVKCFLKDEFYTDYKALRMICSREDFAKTYLGPIFKSIEHEVFKLPFFVKGLTEQERVKKLNELFGTELCYVTDYSAFETHFVKDLMNNCEMVMYKYMLSNFPEAYDLVKVITGVNKLESKVFHGQIEAVRMSGECNTSLGNGFSNAMLMLFFCSEHGINVGNFVVEGDDGLFQLSREISPSEFEPYGLNLKISPTTAYQSSFCGCIYNPETLTNFGDVLRHVVSFGWCGKKHMQFSEKRRWELLKCRAYSFASIYPGVPLIWKMCRLVIEKGPFVTYARARKYLDRYKDESLVFTDKTVEPLPEDRVYFANLTGVGIEEQLKIEQDFEDSYPELNSPTLYNFIPETWMENWIRRVEGMYF